MTEIVKHEDKVATLKAWFGTPETHRALERLARKHIDPVKLLQMAVRCVDRVPAIADCTPASVVGCILESSVLGLELGMAGGAWLVPFRDHGVKKCQLIPDYRGLMKLARRSGEIKSIEAHAVYEKDEFSYSLGMDRELEHKPFRGGDRGVMTDAYAFVELRPDGYQFEVMSAMQIEAIRKRSPSGNSPAWRDNPAEMYRKTALRRLCKFLPCGHDDNALQRAVALDEQHDAGLTQDIDIVGVQAGGSQAVPTLPASVDEIPPPAEPDAAEPATDPPAEPEKVKTKAKAKAKADERAALVEQITTLGHDVGDDAYREALADIESSEHQVRNLVGMTTLKKLLAELQRRQLAATQAANGPTEGAGADA